MVPAGGCDEATARVVPRDRRGVRGVARRACPALGRASALWWHRTLRATIAAMWGPAERSEAGGGGRGWLAPEAERSEAYPGARVAALVPAATLLVAVAGCGGAQTDDAKLE